MTYIQHSNYHFYPDIEFNLDNGILNYSGKSIINDINDDYYSKSLLWLNNNIHYLEDLVILNLDLCICCPITFNEIKNVINLLLSKFEKDKFIVNWFYKENSIDDKEIGESLLSFFDINLNLIEKNVKNKKK